MGRSRRRVLLIGAGALAVLLLVLLGVQLVRDSDAGPPGPSSGGVPVSDGGGAPSDSGGSGSDPGGGAGDDVPAQPTSAEAPPPGATEPVLKPPSTKEASFDDEVQAGAGLVVEVVSIEAVEAGRDIPGEAAGPAVKVVLSVENRGQHAVDTSGVSVNLTYDGDSRIPAPEVIDDASELLPASLPAGASAEGTFLFAAPLDSDGNVRIMVDVLASEPDVVFSGPRPR